MRETATPRTAGATRARLRPFLVLLHRYVGLVMAGFLVVAGLTGVPLVWYEEIDRALNASMMTIKPPTDDTRVIDAFTLRERALAAHPGARINHVRLHRAAEQAASFWLEFEHAQEEATLEVFIHPHTGDILGSRRWGDITEGWTNLMPFVLRLHEQLAIGTVGTRLFGIIALLWTLDCLVGAWLTLPRRSRVRTTGGVATRWRRAWRVRWRGGAHKLGFDLHRAGGLWLWAAMFVFAWSSVGMNLAPVHEPVMNLIFDHQPPPVAPRAVGGTVMSWTQALATGERLIAAASRSEGFRVIRRDRIGFDPARRVFHYSVRSDRDMIRDWGGTTVHFDAVTGELLGLYLPSGKAAGDTVTNWFLALHFGAAWGWWLRVAVALAGLGVVVVAVTGVTIWWRKRRARTLRRASR